MPKTTLILIRHGETATNVKGLLLESGDLDTLTQNGVDQVKRASLRLKGMRLGVLYCSNELRAIESARIIA